MPLRYPDTLQPTLGWGIVGTGRISTSVVADLAQCVTAEILSVHSRDGSKAAAFAEHVWSSCCHPRRHVDVTNRPKWPGRGPVGRPAVELSETPAGSLRPIQFTH